MTDSLESWKDRIGESWMRNDIGEELKYEEINKEFGKEEGFGLEEWHYVRCQILFSMSFRFCFPWYARLYLLGLCLLENLSSVRKRAPF